MSQLNSSDNELSLTGTTLQSLSRLVVYLVMLLIGETAIFNFTRPSTTPPLKVQLYMLKGNILKICFSLYLFNVFPFQIPVVHFAILSRLKVQETFYFEPPVSLGVMLCTVATVAIDI